MDSRKAKGSLMSKPTLPVEELEDPRIVQSTALETFSPVLMYHDSLKKELLMRKATVVKKSINIAEIELEVACGWLFKRKGIWKASVQDRKPLSRMIKDRPITLISWPQRA
jgi:hypothetical protein